MCFFSTHDDLNEAGRKKRDQDPPPHRVSHKEVPHSFPSHSQRACNPLNTSQTMKNKHKHISIQLCPADVLHVSGSVNPLFLENKHAAVDRFILQSLGPAGEGLWQTLNS